MKLFFILFVFFLAGCASTPKQGFNRVFEEKDLLELNNAGPWEPNPEITEAADSFPLVVVEFPVGVEPDAREALHEHLDNHFNDSESPRASGLMPSLSRELLNKIAYFGLEFSQALREEFPEHTVLVLPTRIVKDEDGRLREERSYNPPPHLMRVLFSLYLEVDRFHDGHTYTDDTWATRISPRIFFEHQPEAAFESYQGTSIRMGTYPVYHTRMSAISPRLTAFPATRKNLNRFPGQDPTMKEHPVSSLEFLNTIPDFYDWLYTLVPYRYEAEETVFRARLESPPTGWTARTSPFGEYWHVVARYTGECLDLSGAFEGNAPEVSYLRLLGLSCDPLTEDIQVLIRKMVTAERRFLLEQDDAWIRKLYFDEWGQTLRTQLLAEFETRKELRANRKRADTAMMLNALSGIASNVAAYQGDISHQANMRNQVGMLNRQAGIQSGSGQFEAEIQQQFDRSLVPVSEAARTVVFQESGEETVIRVENLEDMREKFRKLLLKLFPDTVSST